MLGCVSRLSILHRKIYFFNRLVGAAMNFCFARSPARHVKRMRVCAANVHDKHPLPDLLVVKPSYSRPRVSDDNAYAESRFRTAKYRPEFPAKGFGDLHAARRLGQGIRALVQRRTSPSP